MLVSSTKFHPINVHRVCIVPYCYLVRFMQHVFIMCKIPPQDGVKGRLLPELSHSKCIIIVCRNQHGSKILAFMIPGGYLEGVKEKMTQGTYLQIHNSWIKTNYFGFLRLVSQGSIYPPFTSPRPFVWV